MNSLYESEYVGCLDESGASLSRVLKVLDEGIDFIFITASRGSYSKKENATNNNALIKYIRSEVGLKIGAYKIIGHWRECSNELKDDETISDCKGTVSNTLEETWLITKPDTITSEEFNELAQKVARKYEQDAYVIRMGGILTLNGKDGSVWSDLGQATSSSLSSGFEKIVNVQGYSELSKMRKKGRSSNIVFEGIYVAVPKDSISSKRLFHEANILY